MLEVAAVWGMLIEGSSSISLLFVDHENIFYLHHF